MTRFESRPLPIDKGSTIAMDETSALPAAADMSNSDGDPEAGQQTVVLVHDQQRLRRAKILVDEARQHEKVVRKPVQIPDYHWV